MVQPEVPANYVRWGIPGHVVVTFQINEAGRTTNIRVVETDDMTYARIVKEAVRRWRFEKPEILGVTYRLPVNFTHQGRLG